MTDNPVPVNLVIMGKEYKIACSPEERDDLVRAALHLDSQMRQIRDSGKVIGPERIAVMAALNLTHDLIQMQNQNHSIIAGFSEQIAMLLRKVESTLENA